MGNLTVVSRLTLASDVDLRAVVNACPAAMTGADFSALVSGAVMKSLSKIVQLMESNG